jgi:hypothetical protein
LLTFHKQDSKGKVEVVNLSLFLDIFLSNQNISKLATQPISYHSSNDSNLQSQAIIQTQSDVTQEGTQFYQRLVSYAMYLLFHYVTHAKHWYCLQAMTDETGGTFAGTFEAELTARSKIDRSPVKEEDSAVQSSAPLILTFLKPNLFNILNGMSHLDLPVVGLRAELDLSSQVAANKLFSNKSQRSKVFVREFEYRMRFV